MKWNNKKKRTSGVFAALNNDVMSGVPDYLSDTPAARIEMYYRVLEALAADAEFCIAENIANTGKIEVALPWTMLDFPKDGVGRARKVNAGHVGNIVQNYDKGSYQVPVVVMRPVFDDNGELVTVFFEVTDGMHRRTVTLERVYASHPEDLRTGINPVKIRVGISEVAQTEDTARSFSNNNATNPPPTKSDIWRNMYIAGVESVVDTVALAAEYGIDATESVGSRSWPRASGRIIQTMRNITDYNTPGEFPWIKEQDVRNALRFIIDPECNAVYKDHKAIDRRMFFGGLCHFIAFYLRPGYVNDVGMRRLLSTMNVINDTITVANSLNASIIKVEMPFVTDEMLAGTVDSPRNENMRYLGVANALRRIYVRLVPPPKHRGGASSWSDCPAELRQLFHAAPKIVDEAERQRFIDELHAKITNGSNYSKNRTKNIVR